MLPEVLKSTVGSASLHRFSAVTLFDPLLQNIINEKIYLVLWFWYAFLVPVSFIFGFYRLFTILCYTIRFNLLYKTVQTGNKSIQRNTV